MFKFNLWVTVYNQRT